MRITNNMLVNNMMYNMGNNLQRLDTIQQQLATGKKIATPSDDPIVASRALKMRTDVAEVEQYQKNVDDASSWLDITESTIGNIGDLLKRARELAVQASSDSMSANDRITVAAEAEQIKKQIIQISNTTYAGRYIFSGFQTDKPLVDQNTEKYNITVKTAVPNREDIKYEVGIGDKININVLGSELLGGAGTTGTAPKMIDDMNNFITALKSNNTAGISTTISNIDNNVDNVLMIRADVGARTNRLELTKNRLAADDTNFTKLMSQNEDADMAEVIMKLKNEENVYNASLSGGARIIQPTLVDFLR
jgi:flagellar hook-associated protein 3 FlgL